MIVPRRVNVQTLSRSSTATFAFSSTSSTLSTRATKHFISVPIGNILSTHLCEDFWKTVSQKEKRLDSTRGFWWVSMTGCFFLDGKQQSVHQIELWVGHIFTFVKSTIQQKTSACAMNNIPRTSKRPWAGSLTMIQI